MWSPKFVVVGISTATIVAALSVYAILVVVHFVTGSPIPLSGAPDFEQLSCTVGVVAYPVCWFFTIQRARDYGMQRTLSLVLVTYGISCLLVAGLVCLLGAGAFLKLLVSGIFKMIVGTIPMNWEAIVLGVPFALLIPLGAALAWTIVGGVILLPAFLAIATPAAYFHRWLLVRLFGAENREHGQVATHGQ